jgi:hypothetical protein
MRQRRAQRCRRRTAPLEKRDRWRLTWAVLVQINRAGRLG